MEVWRKAGDGAPAANSIRRCYLSEHHHARERTQTDEQKAQAIISARLKKLGWAKADLVTRRKSDPHKVALARDLRSQTTMSLKWIAQRLEMGSWTHVSNLLRQ